LPLASGHLRRSARCCDPGVWRRRCRCAEVLVHTSTTRRGPLRRGDVALQRRTPVRPPAPSISATVSSSSLAEGGHRYVARSGAASQTPGQHPRRARRRSVRSNPVPRTGCPVTNPRPLPGVANLEAIGRLSAAAFWPPLPAHRVRGPSTAFVGPGRRGTEDLKSPTKRRARKRTWPEGEHWLIARWVAHASTRPSPRRSLRRLRWRSRQRRPRLTSSVTSLSARLAASIQSPVHQVRLARLIADGHRPRSGRPPSPLEPAALMWPVGHLHVFLDDE